jgi:hypothetical protein
VEDLSNYELLDSLITKEENKIWDKNLLDFSFDNIGLSQNPFD